MTSISIIGIGNMGSAITGIAAKSGAQVQVIARDLAKAQELAGSTGATAATFGDPRGPAASTPERRPGCAPGSRSASTRVRPGAFP